MTSNAEPRLPATKFLCDYVYLDSIRLSHYYAQLSEHGLVTQAKRTKKGSSKDKADFKYNAVVTSGTYDSETSSENSLELQIDAAFSRPLETLNALDGAGYIQRNIADTRMGGLVLAKGAISLFDIRMLKEMWSHISGLNAREATAHIKNHNERAKAAIALKKQNDEIVAIIAKLPHALQGNLLADGKSAWFTLNPDCMLLSPEDLSFKHGSDLHGEWHVLGIVDALPDEQSGQPDIPPDSGDLENVMRTVLAGVRTAFGRPPSRWGITPIMIFRTITPHS